MNCQKCHNEKIARWIRFGNVPELKRIGVFMKQYRGLCINCVRELKK